RAGCPHHLDDASRDSIEVRHGVTGRVFHGDALALDQLPERALERLPRGVDLLVPLAGPMTPRSGLDRMLDCDWRSLARDPREHAPTGHALNAEESARDRVRAAEVEEQPTIDGLALEL